MNKREVRDRLRLLKAFLFLPLYIPHLLLYCYKGIGDIIDKDSIQMGTDDLKLHGWVALLYLLHNDRYFRNVFYHRVGPIWTEVISWLRPADRYFIISKTTKIEAGIKIDHPYSTIINAESIGRNFSCRHLTTLGNKGDDNIKRPVIGDNVTLGANVSIIGPIRIGNNVIIGAGSVVVKDIPDNTVVAGNPARIIKMINS